MNKIICSVCGGTDFSCSFQKFGHSFERCLQCQLLFISPQPTPDQLDKIYGENYYRPWGLEEDGEATREMKMHHFLNLLDQMQPFYSSGKVLDIGCATGFFMEAATQRGWDTYGVEISSYSAHIALKKFGSVKVKNSSLEKAGFSKESFDLLFLSDLIEHVPNLTSFLHEALHVLKPGGGMAVITPNVAGLSAKILRKNWPHFKLEHLFYFSPTSIRYLLEKHGLEVVIITPTSKSLTLNYMLRQLSFYRFPLIGKFKKFILNICPASLGNKPWSLPAGEMFVLARKK